MTCEKCDDIHTAQKEGKTQESCKCDCHPVHVCPSPFTPQPEYPWWTDPTSPGTVPNQPWYPQWTFTQGNTSDGPCCPCTNPTTNKDNLTHYCCSCRCHGFC